MLGQAGWWLMRVALGGESFKEQGAVVFKKLEKASADAMDHVDMSECD